MSRLTTLLTSSLKLNLYLNPSLTVPCATGQPGTAAICICTQVIVTAPVSARPVHLFPALFLLPQKQPCAVVWILLLSRTTTRLPTMTRFENYNLTLISCCFFLDVRSPHFRDTRTSLVLQGLSTIALARTTYLTSTQWPGKFDSSAE